GCNVTLSGRANELPESIHSKLSQYIGDFIYMPCNVQIKSELKTLWDISMAKWHTIDIWINNAGRNTPHVLSWQTEESHTKAIIETNLLGMIYGTQVAAAGMIKQGHGAIYSMEGLGSNNMIQRKTILYGTTKHALTYFMKGLAKELDGTGVIAGRLSPGMVLTEFITKTSDGAQSEVLLDKNFIRLFNILADKPDTVARFFVPRMLRNTKNDAQIAWLTNRKAAWRFLTAHRRKGRLI
ncbi:MAG: SDR family oxidoreductase, partial [Clostridiaceae bacterium]